MLGKIETIGGVKQIVPLTPEAQSGAPLGSFLLVYGNTVPNGYLPLETLFDENQYPALYAMLGTNKTPEVPADLGADFANKQAITVTTNLSYTATENGYIFGSIEIIGSAGGWAFLNGVRIGGGYAESGHSEDAICLQFRINKGDVFTLTINGSIRSDFTSLYFVPFKKYAHVVIKATSGLSESQQDYVLDALLEAGSYSTEEVATGKKWIDGKMIYRRTFYSSTNSFSSSTQFSVPNCDVIVQYGNMYRVGYSAFYGVVQKHNSGASTYLELLDWVAGNWTLGTSWWVEYTKSS